MWLKALIGLQVEGQQQHGKEKEKKKAGKEVWGCAGDGIDKTPQKIHVFICLT